MLGVMGQYLMTTLSRNIATSVRNWGIEETVVIENVSELPSVRISVVPSISWLSFPSTTVFVPRGITPEW